MVRLYLVLGLQSAELAEGLFSRAALTLCAMRFITFIRNIECGYHPTRKCCSMLRCIIFRWMPRCLFDVGKITRATRNVCCDFWTKKCDFRTLFFGGNCDNQTKKHRKTLVINRNRKQFYKSLRTTFLKKNNQIFKIWTQKKEYFSQKNHDW